MTNNTTYRQIRDESHLNAISKNNKLINEIAQLRKTALGIGTRKLKIRLNKLSCPLAKAYRIAMEIEDESIQAKNCYGKFRERHYKMKEILVQKLASIFEEQSWIYGKQDQAGLETNHIIYFEMPNCGQISFHCNLPWHIPEYMNEWIGKQERSTYGRLLEGIRQSFGKELLLVPIEKSIVNSDIIVRNVRAN